MVVPAKEYRGYVFDLDNTLYLEFNDSKEYKDLVKTSLTRLKSKGKFLFLATHNKHPLYRLKALGIESIFDEIITEQKDVHPWTNSVQDFTNKADMIQEIMSKYNLLSEDIIFFDDSPYNIKQVSEINVDTVLVNIRQGVRFEEYI